MIEGTLDRIFMRPWESPEGRTMNLYSFKLKEDPNTFYRTGTKSPGIKEGSTIRFPADAKNNVKVPDIEVVSAKAQPPVQAPTTAAVTQQASQAAGGMSKDTYWDRKEAKDEQRQKTIEYQASRNAAIEAAKLLTSIPGTIPMPKAATDNMEVVMSLVDKLTMRFLEDTHRLSPGPIDEMTPPNAPKKRGRAKAAEVDDDSTPDGMPDLG